MNESIILALMIIVGIINMLSVLLILILERANMIGLLKALGANNWIVRKIFLYNSAYILGFGLLLGNFLGLLFCYLQSNYSIITLDEKSYYLSVAPIEIDFWHVLFINIGTFVILPCSLCSFRPY